MDVNLSTRETPVGELMKDTSGGSNRGSDDRNEPSVPKRSSPLASVTVPKSDGAVAPMGEKFTPQPNMGTGSVAVPVFASTSDSRASFSPSLAFQYNTAKGNDGWSVALGQVSRKTDKGIPRYMDDIPNLPPDQKDTFIISGSEDLVPELTREADGTWNLLPPEERALNNVQYLVHRYRPRTEGTFARIERWTSTVGETHWRTISSDNTTTWFGRTENSRIADPADSTKVFTWLLSGAQDDIGNRYEVEYKAEDSVGIDQTQAHEHNRTAASRNANKYIKHIRYGHRVSTLNPQQPSPDAKDQWLFEVIFDYGEHDRDNPTPDESGDWLTRRDPFSTYRSGFEIRSYRLCQRILMFHHFPNEPAVGSNCLVRSCELVYTDVRGNPNSSNTGDAQGTFISAIIEASHRRKGTGTGYDTARMPPLEFNYSYATIDKIVHDVDPQNLENLPVGVDGLFFGFVDLNGEGVDGILSEQADGQSWYYKPALGGGKFGPIEVLPNKPTLSHFGSGQHFMDLKGDGSLDVVRLDNQVKGFSERLFLEGVDTWASFVQFQSIPNLDWTNPNVRFVDLTGDGRPDILVTEQDSIVWYGGVGVDGFGDPCRLHNALDEEKGPRIVLSEAIQTIFLADMSGDGLVDIVRIRPGGICYWPNQGYGRFGPKITMDNTPWLDYSDQWDPSRVRLADVNGNGLTDLIYLGSNGISIHFNEHGNRWASSFVLSVFPVADNWSSIQVADILGNGTACLVWSTSISPNNHQMKYIDLMGGTKPNLLVSMVNNLGIETHVHYASSTKFYLVDKVAGTPWITRIPFPTQVIERIETIDRIGRTYHSCRYVYHHGFYDGLEREMCGFGMVEAYDVEHFDVLDGVSISSTTVSSQPTLPPVNLDPTSSIPPVLTKSWFHTGVWRGDDHISRYLGHEYWEEPGLGFQQLRSMHLPDTNLPSGISLRDGSIVPYSPFAMEAREACRALRGTTIRVEVYTLDGTAKQALPYSVSEANFSINLLQPIASTNQNAVFMVLPREQISFSYDRYTIAPFLGGPEYCSPRVAHTMALEVDRFGNVTKSASIEYGQRHPEPDPHNILTPADKAKQTSPLLTYQETDVTNAIDSPDTYHLPLPSETRTYELLKIRVDGNDPLITNLYPMSTIKSQLALLKDGTHDLPFEEHAGQGAIENHPYRRLIGRSRSLYRKDDFTGPLPLGQLGLRALEYESYSQAFTPETLIAAFVDTGKLPSVAELERIMKEEAKYVHSEGDRNWWIPSGRVFFSSSPSDTPAEELSYAMEHFFLPLRFRDPFYATNFNTESSVVYDKYDLLPIELVDALQNRISAGERNPDPTKPFLRSGVDYRLLMTSVVMDPNDNVTAFAFDILGLVSGVAVMGKPGQNAGDSLDGFLADLSDAEVAAYFADPVGNGPALLGNATSRTIFDVHAYYRTRSQSDSSPAVAASLTRETHVSDLPQDTTSIIQHSFAYSDGVGRVIQNKIRGEPGVVPQRDPATDKIIVSTDGQPILTDAPVDPRWIASGWTIFNNKGLPVRQYEPFFTDRLSFEFDVRIGVSPIIFYDAVGRNIGVANPNHTWSKVVANPWRQETWDLNDTALVSDPRTDPDLGGHFSLLPDDDYLPTWSTAREGGALGTEQQQCAQKTAVHANTPTVSYRDAVGGTILTIVHNRFKYGDAAPGDPTIEEFYTMRVDVDIQGNRRQIYDSRERLVTKYTYGMLGQPVYYANMESGERWVLLDIEGKPKYTWDSRGHRFRAVFDQLQRTTETYQQSNADPEVLTERAVFGDTMSSPAISNSRLSIVRFDDQAGVAATDLYDFKGNPITAKRILAQDYRHPIDWLSAVPLETEAYSTISSYDALDRATRITLPDGTIMQPTYNIPGQIKRVEATLAGDSTPTTFVSNIEYNARGQRTSITLGNGVSTLFEYDRLTNRLVHSITKRDPTFFPGDCPQPPLPGWSGCQIQNLYFTDDPMGNGTDIRDDAQQSIFFRNQKVDPTNSFIYDAVYRLIEANGREHLGLTGGLPNAPTPPGSYNRAQTGIAHPNDGRAMGRYTERYSYDSCGNILSMRHIGSQPVAPGWTRQYVYRERSLLDPTVFSNRLSSTSVGSTNHEYGYDDDAGRHGNITSMPHLSRILWDSRDQLRLTSRQVVTNGGTPETTFYVYDSGGARLRKVTERQSDPGVTPTRKSETIYLGGFEVHRDYENDGSTVKNERKSVHVTDGIGRIALVETLTKGTSNGTPETLIRYQLASRLSSAKLELDQDAQILSYEEYSPFGSTTYQGVANQTAAKKRYRFGGKEREEESGFYYYGVRYYLPWLGRWASCDPAGHVDGPNLFEYVKNNPIGVSDPTGAEGEPERLPMDLDGTETEEDIHRMARARGCDYEGKAEKVGLYNWSAPTLHCDTDSVGDGGSGGSDQGEGEGNSGSDAENDAGDNSSGSEGPPVSEPTESAPSSPPPAPAAPPGPSTGNGASSPQPPERSLWSRGLGTVAAGALTLGIGLLLVSNPVGWFAVASGVLAVAAGGFGVGHGLAHLATSGNTTPEEDKRLNQDASTVMSFVGSVGGLAGGTIGYLATGTREGLDAGAFVGGLVEGGAMLAKGIGRAAIQEGRYWRGPDVSRHAGNLNKMAGAHWKAAAPKILKLFGHTRQTAAARMRPSPVFTSGRERLILSHVFPRASTKRWMHIFNRPWNVKLIWESEHALVDSASAKFIQSQFRPATYTGWKRLYHLTPQWMHDTAFGLGRTAQTATTKASQ